MRVALYKRAVQCLDAKMGIVSNNNVLIGEKRYFQSAQVESLLANVHQLPEIPYKDVDADFIVLDEPQVKPCVSIGERTCFSSGDFSNRENDWKDVRYSLLGSLGLFFGTP